MLACPTCRKRLHVSVVRGVDMWHCTQCGGRATALSKLRLPVQRRTVDDLWRSVTSGEGKPGKRCPACLRRMLEVVSSTRSRIALDVCSVCRFVWFDPREFEDVLAQEGVPNPRERAPDARVVREPTQTRISAPRIETWKYVPAVFGLPVEYDANPLKRQPWTTWIVAAVVVVTSLLAFENLGAALRAYALVPAEVGRAYGLTILTAFFLHGSLLHLLSNMYFLLVFGDNVEDYLGFRRYLVLLFGATLVGGLLHVLGDPQSTIPCIGASGGISGVITFYALEFPRIRIGFFPFVMRIPIPWWIRLPAWGALVVWIVIQVALAWLQLTGRTNVSALAHLGGATCGLFLWLLWRRD
ncbi:MAG: rhomboid family intramembrane serine protease [Planctomycetes bacterium]|nr:rhomboid family intramembrane serine protease [Planctomycetota bacterium]